MLAASVSSRRTSSGLNARSRCMSLRTMIACVCPAASSGTSSMRPGMAVARDEPGRAKLCGHVRDVLVHQQRAAACG